MDSFLFFVLRVAMEGRMSPISHTILNNIERSGWNVEASIREVCAFAARLEANAMCK
jgi:hypothetical protein